MNKTHTVTVGFLLGETQDMNMLKDSAMLKRLNDIGNLLNKDKECRLCSPKRSLKTSFKKTWPPYR